MIAYPLEKLGEVYRIRGDAALARVTYEEALRHAEEAGDVQGLGPTLTGLARTVAADDPDEAERLAQRALALGPGMQLLPLGVAIAGVAPGGPRVHR